MEQEWILCDLHTHSQYSKINKNGDKDKVREMSAAEFVNILHAKGIKLFSITDHNYFSKSYYDEIENYIRDAKLNMKVIAGVELDTYVTISNQKKDFIHICFYFQDTENRKNLENTINSLYIDEDGKELNPTFPEILEKLYDLNTKFIVIPHGDKDKRGIFNIVLKNNFSEKPEFYKYAMYKIYNAFDVRPNFYEKSIKHWAANFYKYSKSFNEYITDLTDEEIKLLESNLVSKIKNEGFILNEKEQEIFDYIMNYGSYFAYFSFSDWHNNSEYSPEVNNFIFGSLDYAFESFEMATLDPESRVQQSQDKFIEIPTTMLKEVKFKITGKEKRAVFSPGLNAIVGKRGSGKSLLLAVIKNLVDKDSDKGALKLYKKLKISDISAIDRGGISISLGGLNSVEFLTQNNINDIFENPEKAEAEISKNFKTISSLDKTKLYEIINIAKQIKPYNVNYKNVTNNLLSLKKLDTYSFRKYDFTYNNEIIKQFDNAIKSLKSAKISIEALHINGDEIQIEIDKIDGLKNNYGKLLELYNSLILSSNSKIDELNKMKTSNQTVNSTNRKAISDAKMILLNNLEIKLLLEKLNVAIDEFNIENPPVEVKRKGKYLFVTYYEIPDDINDKILEQLTKAINRSSTFKDIRKYVINSSDKRLNKSASSLAYYLENYINGDNFKCKNAFFEIQNTTVDYEKEIKNIKDLTKYVETKDLLDLTGASLGTKSVAYLDMLFDLEGNILVLDQPEDNIDNDYISNYLVPNIKKKKKIKQLIFVTHNPSVAVYGDAFNYIFVDNDKEISYTNYFIEKVDDKEKLIKILEGGKESFSNRNKKFGNILGAEEYGNSEE